jgi:hypothetical protein
VPPKLRWWNWQEWQWWWKQVKKQVNCSQPVGLYFSITTTLV